MARTARTTIWSLQTIATAGLLLTAPAQVTAALDTIGGPLPKVVKNTGAPYYVQADIEVPADRMVTVEEGVVFLFKGFTGLHVQGRLEIKGSEEKPVVFTSENDKDHNPGSSLIANPYDWNGVYIHSDGLGSTLDHIKVLYSVYGIVSETKFIRVDPGEFRDNGKSNLVVEGVEQAKTPGTTSFVLSTKDATVDGIPVKLLRDPAAPRRNVFRFAGLGLLVVGAGLGVFETIQASGASEELDELSNDDVATLQGFDNLRYGSSEEWEDTRDRRTWSIVGAAAGYTVGAIGGVGFGWSFTF